MRVHVCVCICAYMGNSSRAKWQVQGKVNARRMFQPKMSAIERRARREQENERERERKRVKAANEHQSDNVYGTNNEHKLFCI